MNASNTPTEKMPSIKDFPDWMVRIIKREVQLDKRYERAYEQFADAYGQFLMKIDIINEKFGTNFTFKQAVEQLAGVKSDVDVFDEEEFDDIEDDEYVDV